MQNKILNTIKKYSLIEKNEKILIGVSGGPDSMCLLNLLNQIKVEEKIKIQIVVAHINHLLREEATDEESYVEEYCLKNNIPFYSKKIDVEKIAKKNKTGLEETARNVRYEYFDEISKMESCSKIATGHNKNDNAETVIMNILRGTGINGLKGIDIKRNKYIRPLLECERTEIEKYCELNNLNPKIDKSNLENDYTRNKIRNIVIPYIKEEFNPNIIESIERLSNLVNEEEEYFKKEVNKNIEVLKIVDFDNKLDKEILEIHRISKEKLFILKLLEFNNLDKVIKSRVILQAINTLFTTAERIEKIHIEDIIKLCEKAEGNKYLTPNKYFKVLIKNKKIYFINLK